eukprot:3128901-Alexandrium_andersonii.AAC.1
MEARSRGRHHAPAQSWEAGPLLLLGPSLTGSTGVAGRDGGLWGTVTVPPKGKTTCPTTQL